MRGGAVALVVPGGDPEDDGGLGADVDVGGGQALVHDGTGGLGAAEDPHEGQLVGGGGDSLGVAAHAARVGGGTLHGQVDLKEEEEKTRLSFMPCSEKLSRLLSILT